MKIYLLVSSFPYEGYDLPEYAYSTRKRANKKLKELETTEKKNDSIIDWYIHTIDIDVKD